MISAKHLIHHIPPKTRNDATRRASALKKFMDKYAGGRWQMRVHWNLGWFYGVELGSISVSPWGYVCDSSADRTYFSTIISDKKGVPGGGLINWSGWNGSSNPILSVRKAIRLMEAVVSEYVETANDNRVKMDKRVFWYGHKQSAITNKRKGK